jgi:hypothetical protein
VLVILGLFLALGAAYVFRDKIKERVVTALNDQLRTEVDVETIEIELFSTFPRISVAFREVFVAGHGPQKDSLATAESLFLELNSMELLQGEYKVDRIRLEGGEVRVHHWGDGSWSYDILVPGDSPSQKVEIVMEQIELYDMMVRYTDHISTEEFHSYMHEATLGLTLGDAIEIELDLRAEDPVYLLDGERWSVEGLSSWKGALVSKGDKLEIPEMQLSRGAFQLILNGQIKESVPELRLRSKGLDLRDLLDIMPPSKRTYMEPYQFRGKCELDGTISGNTYDIQFSVVNGGLKQEKVDLKIDRLDLKGSISGDLRSLSSAELELTEYFIGTSAGDIRGTLQVIDLEQPHIRTSFAGKLQMKDIFNLLEDELIEDPLGTLEFALDFSNRFEGWDWTADELRSAKSSGWLKIHNGRGKIRSYDQDFFLSKAELHYDDRNLLIDQLEGEAGGSSFSFQGSFQNIWEYILLPDERMHLDARFMADRILLDNWLRSGSEDSDGDFEFHINPRLSYQLRLDIESLIFQSFQAEDISGLMTQNSGVIAIRDLKFKHSGGDFNGDLHVHAIGEEYLDIYSDSELNDMDIRNIFKSFDDFGQSTLRAEHIGGIGDAHIQFYGRWGTNLQVDLSSIKVQSSVQIRGGELKGFEPLEYLSDYVDIGELRHVKFSELSNTIEIKDQRIYIPEMEIKSSALDFGAYGDHSFDNQINYLVRLELTDVMFKEKRLENPDMEDYVVVEDDGLAPNLYLRMTGDVYDPEIRYDMKAAGKDVARDWQEEKEEIKDAWQSTFNKDSTETNDEGPRYELEWNDSTDIEDEYGDL